MQVFWERGYEGVSLTDLTKAMGITKPSLYAAFGDKKELFRKALERYTEGPADYGTRALEEPTARGVAAAILHGAVRTTTRPGGPAGCMGVQVALASSEAGRPAHDMLVEWRNASALRVEERFQRAVDEGDLPRDADPDGSPDMSCRRRSASPSRPPAASAATNSRTSPTWRWSAGCQMACEARTRAFRLVLHRDRCGPSPGSSSVAAARASSIECRSSLIPDGFIPAFSSTSARSRSRRARRFESPAYAISLPPAIRLQVFHGAATPPSALLPDQGDRLHQRATDVSERGGTAGNHGDETSSDPKKDQPPTNSQVRG